MSYVTTTSSRCSVYYVNSVRVYSGWWRESVRRTTRGSEGETEQRWETCWHPTTVKHTSVYKLRLLLFFYFFLKIYILLKFDWLYITQHSSADVIVKPRLQLNKTKIKQFYFSLIFVVTAASSWKKNYFRAFLCKKSFEYIKKMNCLKYNDVYNSWNWFCQIFMNNRNYDY